MIRIECKDCSHTVQYWIRPYKAQLKSGTIYHEFRNFRSTLHPREELNSK